MKTLRLGSLALLMAIAGCDGGAAGNRSSAQETEEGGDVVSASAECVKLEAGELAVGAVFLLNGVEVTVVELVYKDGHQGGEIIGFKVSANGSGLSYLVKAGGSGFYGSNPSWVNPNGTSGPDASAISHVTICIGDTSGGIGDNSIDTNNPEVCIECPGTGDGVPPTAGEGGGGSSTGSASGGDSGDSSDGDDSSGTKPPPIGSSGLPDGSGCSSSDQCASGSCINSMCGPLVL
jgi:hypothetical protein